MRVFVLAECAPGEAGLVARSIRRLKVQGLTVFSADAVIGPLDVIAIVETPDLETLALAVTERLPDGVKATVTCVEATPQQSGGRQPKGILKAA
jgi:hypothetical protein